MNKKKDIKTFLFRYFEAQRLHKMERSRQELNHHIFLNN